MRETFTLSAVFRALSAWEVHEASYVASFTALNKAQPSSESLRAYRATWLEGYLNALSDAEPVAEEPSQPSSPS